MIEHKLRILFNTNGPHCPSGYAQQAYDLLPQIKEAGFPLACIAFYGLEGGTLEWNGIKMYPRIDDVWGGDAMVMHSKDFKADIVITLQDLWPINPDYLKQIPRFIPYVPIDHDPCPPIVLDRVKLAYRVISMSKFGHDELKTKGVHSTFIQHSINTDQLKPMDSKEEAKKKLGIPTDLFMFGMVAANKDVPPRKSFQECMDAFKMFHDKHPKSGLYFHTLTLQQGGFPIEEYAKFIGIEKSMFKIDPYANRYLIKREDMGNIFNAFDCYLAPSTNGGFEIPIIEAGSCGVPVITQPFTAMKDLVIDGETGYMCKTATKRFTPLLSNIGIPDTQSIYECMEKVFATDRVEMGRKAREFVVKNFDCHTVFREKWLPFLEKVEREIYPDIDKQVDTQEVKQ